MSKKKELESLQREHSFSYHLWNENKELRKKIYEPFTHDMQMKEMAVEFGKFLISMNVRNVGDNKYKTNSGMAPDMITESLEQMYDRVLQSKLPL